MDHPFCHKVKKIIFIGIEWKDVIEADEEKGYIIFYVNPKKVVNGNLVTKKLYGNVDIIFTSEEIRKQAEKYYE